MCSSQLSSGFRDTASDLRLDRRETALQEPVLPKAFTRFRMPWRFDGREAVIASRAVDESGYAQPTREALVEVRGVNSAYHYNGIKLWRVRADGTVTNVDA